MYRLTYATSSSPPSTPSSETGSALHARRRGGGRLENKHCHGIQSSYKDGHTLRVRFVTHAARARMLLASALHTREKTREEAELTGITRSQP